MNLVKKSLSKWISDAIILVVGILCIVAGATLGNADESAMKAISVILGIVALVLGVAEATLAIVLSVQAKKSFLLPALSGAVLIALGICFIVTEMAAEIIIMIIAIAPYLFIVIGALALADAIVNMVKLAKVKLLKKNLPLLISVITISLVAIVIGSLCASYVIGGDVQLIVFGIMLIFVAVFIVLLTFIKMPDTVVAFIKVKDKE